MLGSKYKIGWYLLFCNLLILLVACDFARPVEVHNGRSYDLCVIARCDTTLTTARPIVRGDLDSISGWLDAQGNHIGRELEGFSPAGGIGYIRFGQIRPQHVFSYCDNSTAYVFIIPHQTVVDSPWASILEYELYERADTINYRYLKRKGWRIDVR